MLRLPGIAVVVFVVGCVSYKAPSAPPPSPEATVALSVDDAWRRTLDYLASAGIAVTSSDKAGGVISARPTFTGERLAMWVNCGTANGKPAVESPQWSGVVTTGDLSVTIRPAGGATVVRPVLSVTATWERPVVGGSAPQNCVSQGRLEKDLVTALKN
jgi:hypothetical protein